MKHYLICIITILFASCERNPDCPKGSHTFVEIVNNSNKKIYWDNYGDYPNKIIGENSPINNTFLTLLPNKSVKFYTWRIRYDGSCWESKFKQVQKVNIYFFDADVIEKTAWSEVQKNNIGLLERREIDLDYCIKNNWQVIYK